ncbi:glycosyltransferase family 4 protein [Novosphingobium sp. KCTC 2891]|uniref:glycosyltransferase family 4 protein n=1 Tax=Novosphingobium sp. KCTC 2891 TaxID=2989730 RepID=UPI002223B75D|nr:glycosyltransferase family 1 protein [Novosphingobium sp. KCTC 2891]MCW1382719.1 glycosyltransferase family 4 protein [Novosphingobium sp. KCTC 2891]
MSLPRKIIINGKFLIAEATGVHRVAGELITHAHRLIDERGDLARQLALELWVPAEGAERARSLGVPFRIVGPLGGRAWEQITLPIKAGNRIILSLCNVGVVAAHRSVTMIHDAQVRSTPQSYSLPFRLWYRFQHAIAGRRHERILTVSEFSRGQLDQYGIARADKTGVILNGIDHLGAATADSAIVARLGLRRGRFAVSLANTQAHKNIAMLLRAFAAPELADIPLVLFGSASADSFRAAGVAVPPNAIFAGRVSDAELRALYEAALCIAFPSSTEGFGLPPLEAMLAGCPAVVAPAGALPEVCGDAALYAHHTDPAAWTDAIVRLAGDADLRAELIAKGRDQAAKFTWRSAATRLVDELLALA